MPMSESLKKEVARGESKKEKRGAVNNAKRLKAFGERGGKGEADWGTCDPHALQAVVVTITGLGGAITIGLSRDKGAHFMTLLLDDGRETLWFNGNADLDGELRAVSDILESL